MIIDGIFEGNCSGFDAATMQPITDNIYTETFYLKSGSTLRNVCIKADTCIMLEANYPYCSNITIENCILMGHTGIDVKDRSGNTLYGTLRIDNNLLACTHYGIRLFNCNDWCMLTRNELQPGLFGHDVSEGSNRWIAQHNCIAYDLQGLQDWTILRDCCSWATLIGVHCSNTVGPIQLRNVNLDAAIYPLYLGGNSVDKILGSSIQTAFNTITRKPGAHLIVDWNTTVNYLDYDTFQYGPEALPLWTGGSAIKHNAGHYTTH